MKAEEFVKSKGYTVKDKLGWIIDQSELIELLDEFAEQQNKELIERNKELVNRLELLYSGIDEIHAKLEIKETGKSGDFKPAKG